MSGRLAVRREAGVLRHQLEGNVVQQGQVLELLLPDGRWQVVRYEWMFQEDIPVLLRMQLGGPWESGAIPRRTWEARVLVPGCAIFRWPVP